ncbi:hypothetical protein FZC83_02090 [Rossellomorea marisflavi]|uniref:Uncharacterized protein n=1 Tax=Rossellomorea marisflavi TaxID=189381 RepID=A0A5D4S3Q2_9BACI|nr:hypothetical protein [Rossellomorea marisflavi]TYS56386.1 hypothetical protein FZC83_02090 [Rossellomorea marisflavi]
MTHDKDYQDFYIVDDDGDKLEVTFMSNSVCLTTVGCDTSVYITDKDLASLEKVINYLKEI